jgi:hypothetical protein
MSFILAQGDDAVEKALKTEVDFSKMLVSLTNGKSYKVRALAKAVVNYNAHSSYGVFYTTPCTKHMGQPDLYDKAVDLLYKDAKAIEEGGADKKAVDDAKNYAYGLKAKSRYMVGFVNLTTGQPIVIDFTSKQGKQIVAKLKEYKDDLEEFAFKISKSGSSNATVLNFDLLVRPQRDLTQEEQNNFAASAGHEFNMSAFEEVLQINDEQKQLEDLHAYGFDVTRLGFDVPTKKQNPNAGSNEQEKPKDEEF